MIKGSVAEYDGILVHDDNYREFAKALKQKDYLKDIPCECSHLNYFTYGIIIGLVTTGAFAILAK